MSENDTVFSESIDETSNNNKVNNNITLPQAKNTLLIISVVLSSLSTILLLLILILHYPSSTKENFVWEYKKVIFTGDSFSRVGDEAFKASIIYVSENYLNELGEEGWELVSTTLEMETAFPNFGREEYVTGIRENTRPQRMICIFKRKVVVNQKKEDKKT